MSRRILIISYWFPPAGGIPVQRALSLARYLPENGFEVHVLAPRNPPAPIQDPALLNLIPPQVKVHRAFTPMPPSDLRQKLWRMISKGKETASKTAADSSHSPAFGMRSVISGLIRRLLSPDPEVLWIPFAKRPARRIVRRYAIDAVLVTAPPFSAFLVGNSLKREFPHVLLIRDFRDEWLRVFLLTFVFHTKSARTRANAE